MQFDVILVEVPIQYVRMLQSHLPDSPPARKYHLCQLDHCCNQTSGTLLRHRLHEYNAVILDPVDFHGKLNVGLVELGATLSALGTPVLYWSDGNAAGTACAQAAGRSRRSAQQVVTWLQQQPIDHRSPPQPRKQQRPQPAWRRNLLA